jgi:cell division septal protein FtsQ
MAKRTRRTSANERAVKRATRGKSKRGPKGSSNLGKHFLPVFLSFCLLVCLSALGFIGFRTATASQFFDVSRIEVDGVLRASKSDIERLVSAQSIRAGVWNADLPDIKSRIEKLPFVKTAAVSRILPNGLRATIDERVPKAIVRMSSGDFLVDEEGAVLARAESAEPEIPFVMIGWDERKSPQADKDNLTRVKMYQRMLADWQQFDLAARVNMVNLADLSEPRAFTEDSGQTVSIALSRDNFGEHLKRGIGAVVGKGSTFEAVNLVGPNMILVPRKK